MRCVVHWIATVLVLVGALNWGLVGFFDFNLVTYLAGQWPMVEKVVYDLVGVAAVVYVVEAIFCKCSEDGKGSCCGNGKC